MRIWLATIVALIAACTSAPKVHKMSLDEYSEQQMPRSLAFMGANISPTEPKQPGGPKPRPGIVVAGLSRSQPDYYFHWVRDAAHVMSALSEALRVRAKGLDVEQAHQWWRDHLNLNAHLQREHDMGEPRFTVTGDVDRLPWSRPQYDGPALRVLSLLEYAPLADPKDQAQIQKLVRKDLDYLLGVYTKKGFDIWEERKADNYQTRLSQLAAFEKGGAYLHSQRYERAAQDLRRALNQHWSPEKGFLRAQTVIERTDGYTKKQTDLDTAVIIAVLDADLRRGEHSVLDDRVQATVVALLKSAATYGGEPGPAFGRYEGDVYFGGHPWFLVTAYMARFHYALAERLKHGETWTLTERNRDFVLGLGLRPDVEREVLIKALEQRGDLILKRLQKHTPSDGQLFEQFDQVTGVPLSAPGLGWSHAALLRTLILRSGLLSK